MNSPSFTVIIPTYNRASLIRRTIDSVLAQSIGDFEVIIVDDGSTDNTKEVVNSISDERIRYFKKDNQERACARNFGIDKAEGKYVTFLDSDDLFYPQHLELAHRETKLETPVFWMPYEEIDHTGNVLKTHKASEQSVIDKLIDEGNFLSCHGVFILRSVLEDIRFNEDRALSGSEDMELWLRLASRYEIKQMNQVTNALVHHDQRSVFNFDKIEALVKRKELMLHYIQKDEHFMTRYSSRMNRIRSRAYSYIALHSALNPNNSLRYTFRYAFKAITEDPKSAFDRRTFAIAKHCLQRILRLS